MKRILSLILAIFLLMSLSLTLASCDEKDPEKLVNKAIEKTSKLDKIESEMEIIFSGNLGDLGGMLPSFKTNITAKGLQSQKPTVRATTTAAGENMTDIYLEDETVYAKTPLGSFKASAASAEESVKELVTGLKDQYKSVDKIPAEFFSDITKVEELDDGSKKVSVTVTEKYLSELLGDTLDELTALGGNISNGKMDITVNKKGYVSEIKYNFDMKVKVLITSIDFSASVTVKNIKFGNDVNVTPIDGYKEFADYSKETHGY